MIFEDQLAALERRLQEGRHAGRRTRFRPAGRRPRRRARAGHHHRRGLPLFSTDKRKFIVADTPGHEQYTRNMVTGRLDRGPGRDPDRRAQGRADADAAAQLPGLADRHPPRSCWRSTRWIWSATTAAIFETIVADYRDFAQADRPDDFVAIPVSGCAATTSRDPQRSTRPGITARR